MALVTFGNNAYAHNTIAHNYSLGVDSAGLQWTATVETQIPRAVQWSATAAALTPQGLQWQAFVEQTTAQGLQWQGIVASTDSQGMQWFSIVANTDSQGMQWQGVVEDSAVQGVQWQALIASSAVQGLQWLGIVEQVNAQAVQWQGIAAGSDTQGYEGKSDTLLHLRYPRNNLFPHNTYAHNAWIYRGVMGLQWQAVVPGLDPQGLQWQGIVEDSAVQGVQWQGIVVATAPLGLQWAAGANSSQGVQWRVAIYNTNNLRVMCVFDSRGVTGTNWTASSTETGDFDVNNLNTDIVEQVWRSASGTLTANVDCDTELAQGVALDTLAILNHNFTSSVNLVLQGASDAGFASVEREETLQYNEANIYYIAAELPLTSQRYWRLNITDNTNPAGYLQMGTVVFGTTEVFQEECFTDRVGFEITDYADSVRTEGFTNVANSRTIKRKVSLEFRDLIFDNRNFQLLRNLFVTYRTTTKCLWIPTPSPTRPDINDRFAVFGKLVKIPSETHNSKAADYDYVTFNVDIDESL